MKNHLLLCLFGVFPAFLFAQTNMRAWYADGQVWVVWQVEKPMPETYAIYAKPTAFTNTSQATLVGRLFRDEYLPAAMKEQVDTSLTYRIPNGQGGAYQLKADEGLFVFTPHKAGSSFFAVVAWGNTAVNQGVNLTQTAVQFQYNPVGDPVECHLQKTFISPFDSDYRCFAFYMWADGRQNQWENRPDFPVMANAAKNGMPSFFMISAPLNLDTTGGIPLSVWLHGGGGTARQSLAGSRQDIHLNPKQGILLAHNDDFFCYLLTYYSGFGSSTKHFGWRKNFDPFTGEAPTAVDTIVNYTLRRYRWIDDWLVRNYHVDPARININGHSMGSRGTTMLAKTFPDHYASATILNNGGADDDPPALIDIVYGPTALKFPSNLTDYNGNVVPFVQLTDYTTRLSNQRDLPLMRFFHSKNDKNDAMLTGNSWDAGVVANFRAADSLGNGAVLSWSERAHGPDTGPDYNDHWINGNAATQQTVVDDIAYEEAHFRSDISFPAFFNHRLDPDNNDPGTGKNGINNGDGDNWGTWGGYHRWENTLEDAALGWQTTAWLESGAVFGNDNCPENSLKADLAIRKPQKFKPTTGKTLKWTVKDAVSGQVLQNGQTTVRADNLVVIPQIEVFRESIRKVRISIFDPSVPTSEAESVEALRISPNPTNGQIFLKTAFQRARVFDLRGQLVLENPTSESGQLDVFALPSGVYFLEILTGNNLRKVGRFVKS